MSDCSLCEGQYLDYIMLKVVWDKVLTTKIDAVLLGPYVSQEAIRCRVQSVDTRYVGSKYSLVSLRSIPEMPTQMLKRKLADRSLPGLRRF